MIRSDNIPDFHKGKELMIELPKTGTGLLLLAKELLPLVNIVKDVLSSGVDFKEVEKMSNEEAFSMLDETNILETIHKLDDKNIVSISNKILDLSELNGEVIKDTPENATLIMKVIAVYITKLIVPFCQGQDTSQNT